MSDDQSHLRVGELFSIHAAITALSVDVGRLSEKLTALDDKVVRHTSSEHQEFKDTLTIVQDMRKQITAIENIINQQRGAWWALAKIGAVIIGVSTLITYVAGWWPKK